MRRVSASRLVGVVFLVTACASGPPASAGYSTGPAPDLRGQRVMVLPVQAVQGLPESVNAELVFALNSRGADVDWIVPDELRAMLARSPGLDAPIEGLPVGFFMQVEVERVGDPLFGILRRLTAVTGAPWVLIPVVARYRAGDAGEDGTAEVAAALLDARSGRVLWFGVVEGVSGRADEPAVLATALDEMVKTLTGG